MPSGGPYGRWNGYPVRCLVILVLYQPSLLLLTIVGYKSVEPEGQFLILAKVSTVTSGELLRPSGKLATSPLREALILQQLVIKTNDRFACERLHPDFRKQQQKYIKPILLVRIIRQPLAASDKPNYVILSAQHLPAGFLAIS